MMKVASVRGDGHKSQVLGIQTGDGSAPLGIKNDGIHPSFPQNQDSEEMGECRVQRIGCLAGGASQRYACATSSSPALLKLDPETPLLFSFRI